MHPDRTHVKRQHSYISIISVYSTLDLIGPIIKLYFVFAITYYTTIFITVWTYGWQDQVSTSRLSFLLVLWPVINNHSGTKSQSKCNPIILWYYDNKAENLNSLIDSNYVVIRHVYKWVMPSWFRNLFEKSCDIHAVSVIGLGMIVFTIVSKFITWLPW